MEKVYLASRYSRKKEMLVYKKALEELGIQVTSRWLTAPGPRSGEEADPAFQRMVADADTQDILDADSLILFTEVPRKTPTRGGRLTEYGIAIGAGKEVHVIGPAENDFCYLSNTHIYETWMQFYNELFGDSDEKATSETIEKLKEELAQKEHWLKAALAALHDATHDNIDLYKNGRLEMLIVKEKVDEFFNNTVVNCEEDEAGNFQLIYTDKPKPKKTKLVRKTTKGIY